MKFGWKTSQMSTLIFLFVFVLFFTVMESNDVCSASELVFVWSYFTLSMSSWPIVLLFVAHPALTSSRPLFIDRSTCLYISSMSPVSKSSHKGITLHSVCPSGWMESPSTNMDGCHIHHLVICAGFGKTPADITNTFCLSLWWTTAFDCWGTTETWIVHKVSKGFAYSIELEAWRLIGGKDIYLY